MATNKRNSTWSPVFGILVSILVCYLLIASAGCTYTSSLINHRGYRAASQPPSLNLQGPVITDCPDC